jgi:hypothetical protein
MPNKDPKRSAPVRIDETVRRKLEALREDCRRHAEAPVPLECVEGPHEGASALELAHRAGMLQPIAWGWSQIAGGPSASVRAYVGMSKGDPEDRARALVERLGDLVIREPVLAASAGAELPILLAGKPSALLVGAVLIRGSVAPDESSVLAPAPAGGPRPRARTITLEEFAGELEAAPKLGTRRVWRVPCVRAAIAEVCDAILGVTPGAIEVPPKRRRSKEELLHEAMLELVRCEQKGEASSDAEIAAAIGVSPSTFSEQVGSSRKWKDVRAAARRKPGPEAEDSEEIDRSEADEPNAEPNLGPAIVRRKARR